MANNNLFTGQNEQQLAEQLFCVQSSYDKLKQAPRQKPEQSGLLFNDIVQLVRGNNRLSLEGKIPQMMAKINQSLTSRRIYQQLLQQFKFAESGLQAAASTKQELQVRKNEQFSLTFKRDKNYPQQVYVILTIAHPAEHHGNETIVLHVSNHERVECALFPALSDGRSQLLMDDDHHLFKLLSDAHSQLYLM